MSVTVDKENRLAKISGELQLETLDNYEEAFSEVKKTLYEKNELFTFDITGLTKLNSTGIAFFSVRLILEIKKQGIPIKFLASSKVPWQEHSLVGFPNLYDKLELSFS